MCAGIGSGTYVTELDPVTRRRLLATAGAVGIAIAAGCAGRSPSDGVGDSGATDIAMHDAAARSLTITVTITVTIAVTDSETDAPRFDRRMTIGAGETIDAVNRAKLPTIHDYTVTVAVADGPEEIFKWSDPTVERAPL